MTVYTKGFVAERSTSSTSAINIVLPRQVQGVSGATNEHLTCELTLSWSRGSTASLIGIIKLYGIWRFSGADTLDTTAGFLSAHSIGTSPPTGLSFDVNSNNPRFNFTPATTDATKWVLKGSIWIGT